MAGLSIRFAGGAVAGVDGFGFRGTLLAEEDGEDNVEGDGEELSLPGLEGEEPEFCGDSEGGDGERLLVLEKELGAVGGGAGEEMAGEEGEEDEDESKRERVGFDPARLLGMPAAPCVGGFGGVFRSGVGFGFVGVVGVFRVGGAALIEVGAEEDKAGELEDSSLPVF